MPSTISRTYGKKAQTKRKNSVSDDDENNDTKRRRMTPEESDNGQAVPSSSISKGTEATPTKLTKRMLGRSRTESSIDSQQSASVSSRTFSLPTIPSSSSQPQPDDQSYESGRRPVLSSSASTPRVKRTYAGQSRSFLISLPVSGVNPDVLHGIERESQEDDFHEPESYSSLRLRWGVDNSEDDPSPLPFTPRSKSRSSKSGSNNATPSRKVKRKTPAIPLPPNMMNPLKSITELRSKGESRRFLDEVGYLFEGMDASNSVGLKRSSASEITIKLCDDEFARKAKAADFYYKTWDVFLKAGAGRGEDKILDVLLVFLVALIARNPDTLLDLANLEPPTVDPPGKGKGKQKVETETEYGDTLISILFFILDHFADVDPLAMVSPSRSATDSEFKYIGLSKKDKIMLSSIYSTISTRSNLFAHGTPITTTLLITHILQTLPPSILPASHISDLLHSLRSLLQASFPPDEPFDGTYPSTTDGEPQYNCIRHHLHLVDMYLLGQWPSDEASSTTHPNQSSSSVFDKARDEWFVDGLFRLAVCVETKLRKYEAEDEDVVSECLEILLRVFVNLTHGDPTWAQSVISNAFAVPLVVRLLIINQPPSDEEDEDTKLHTKDSGNVRLMRHHRHAWDRLCLALGLLTNLVQSIPEFKSTLRRIKFSPKCTFSNPSCTKKCTCPGRIGALELLANVYNISSPSQSPITKLRHPKIKHESSPTLTPPRSVSPVSTTTAAEGGVAETSLLLIQGTLSILFGLLMVSSEQNKTVILSSIKPRENEDESDRGKLMRLVDQAKQFVAFYDARDTGSSEEEETGNASEVLKVLERLRDEA